MVEASQQGYKEIAESFIPSLLQSQDYITVYSFSNFSMESKKKRDVDFFQLVSKCLLEKNRVFICFSMLNKHIYDIYDI